MNTTNQQANGQGAHSHPSSIMFSIDGKKVRASHGQTILQVAKLNGVKIPHLCYKTGLRPDGNCRVCMVEIERERVLQPACVRTPYEGMVVVTNSERTKASQKMVLELLQSDLSKTVYTRHNELYFWAGHLGVGKPRFESRVNPQADLSHTSIAVNLDACIQCTRCLRACREEQNNDVIGYAMRGDKSKIVFDLDDGMGDSSCVGCGECVQVCPTGAIMPARGVGLQKADKKVDSVCPYCGVGCLLTYHVKDNKILHVEGRDGPSNHKRLCVKGRYGFDYVHHRGRLQVPMIRCLGVPKNPADCNLKEEDIMQMFRPASWDEAMEFTTSGLNRILQEHGNDSLAGFGSAKCSNEEAYLFQKLVRVGFRNNHVDHCTRLCHASSVVALLEGIGSGAVSNQVADVSKANVIFVIGANPTENHPVAATFIKNAARSGSAQLIVLDPRRIELAKYAQHFIQFLPDTDVALLNAIMCSIMFQGLVNERFVAEHTTGFREFCKNLENYAPEKVGPICGVDAATINKIAHLYATAKGSIIFWGMGISQHIHGTDNARCLIAMALMTGQIGRPGCGLHPLRGQNNVQGASDAGLIPMVFPDYQPVDNQEARLRHEKLWGHPLSGKPGLTVTEIMEAILQEKIMGMYIMGENPAMSDPNLNHARKALARLQHLVVQDIFMTETAAFADVILPSSAFPEKTGTYTNTDRRVQLGRQALFLPGKARQDLAIIQDVARGMGLSWNYGSSKEVFSEMKQSMTSISGITWERLEKVGTVTYPCTTDDDPGQSVLFQQGFPTKDGKGKFVPASFVSADEIPDEEYPFVLITGRQLEHWHTGAMTRRSEALNSIEPVAVASMHPDDISKIAASQGGKVFLKTRRGDVKCLVREDRGLMPGQVFIPFCFKEAAANLLTNDAIDPFGKIPEFKFCALQVQRAN